MTSEQVRPLVEIREKILGHEMQRGTDKHDVENETEKGPSNRHLSGLASETENFGGNNCNTSEQIPAVK